MVLLRGQEAFNDLENVYVKDGLGNSGREFAVERQSLQEVFNSGLA